MTSDLLQRFNTANWKWLFYEFYPKFFHNIHLLYRLIDRPACIGIYTENGLCNFAEFFQYFYVVFNTHFYFQYRKIKVGIKNDVEILKELRKITKAVFRVDA